ncbi:MAG: hypothetical protein R2758_06115 [Bacteroidales bacterium]
MLKGRSGPVFFDVTPAACKIGFFAVNDKRPGYRMVKADDAMVAFHKRGKGIWAHDPRSIPGVGPFPGIIEFKFSAYSGKVKPYTS